MRDWESRNQHTKRTCYRSSSCGRYRTGSRPRPRISPGSRPCPCRPYSCLQRHPSVSPAPRTKTELTDAHTRHREIDNRHEYAATTAEIVRAVDAVAQLHLARRFHEDVQPVEVAMLELHGGFGHGEGQRDLFDDAAHLVVAVELRGQVNDGSWGSVELRGGPSRCHAVPHGPPRSWRPLQRREEQPGTRQELSDAVPQ